MNEATALKGLAREQIGQPRRALVTGATSGIGRATALALALARDGHHIIVTGRSHARAEQVRWESLIRAQRCDCDRRSG